MANVYKSMNELVAAGQAAFKAHCERVVSSFTYYSLIDLDLDRIG